MSIGPKVVNQMCFNRVRPHNFIDLTFRRKFLNDVLNMVEKLSAEESFFRKIKNSENDLKTNSNRLAIAAVLYHKIWERFPEDISVSMGTGYEAYFNSKNLIQTAAEFVENSKALKREFDLWWKFSNQGNFMSFFSKESKCQKILTKLVETIAEEKRARFLSEVEHLKTLRERLYKLENQKLHPNTLDRWILGIFEDAEHFFSKHSPSVQKMFETASGTVVDAKHLAIGEKLSYLQKLVELMDYYNYSEE
jgi:hypothetical protein